MNEWLSNGCLTGLFWLLFAWLIIIFVAWAIWIVVNR
jgi:hypothetical protein